MCESKLPEEKSPGKKEKSRRRIMHAAKVLFEKQGLDDVTFSQIAATADVCRTTVFNHFSNTNELMLAIFTQEMEELQDYCSQTGLTGKAQIYALFDRLIEDIAFYPTLATRLIHNAILSKEVDNPIRSIEEITGASLGGNRTLTTLVCGAFYGLINHYHIHNLDFDPTLMKAEFRGLTEGILSMGTDL